MVGFLDSIVNKPNTVPQFQREIQRSQMQQGSEYVFRKTPKDRAVYGLMVGATLTVVGLSLYGFINMAFIGKRKQA